jgi:polar amino acid transport system permease protein
VNYDWDFGIVLQPAYVQALLLGLVTTLRLTGVCILFGTPLGVALGILCSLGKPTTSLPQLHALRVTAPRDAAAAAIGTVVVAFVDVVRAVPLLLLILTSYYALPSLLERGPLAAIGAPTASPFVCAAVAMSINLAVFIADLVRGAAGSISRASVISARALGMSKGLTWRRIILPEVTRELLPAIMLLYITMLKMSTLASVVALYEVLHSAEGIIQQTYRPLELYVVVCALFVAIVLPLSAAGRRLERTRLFVRRSHG